MANNKRKKAVALKYERDQHEAPYVLATGEGHLAEKIIKAANESGIHIHQDEYLQESLSQLNLYDEIPLELYESVAQILSFISYLNEDNNK